MVTEGFNKNERITIKSKISAIWFFPEQHVVFFDEDKAILLALSRTFLSQFLPGNKEGV
ncbi:Uncharacterised protein [Sphingobacterium multivorum]|uniref:Uncharacterized protein n=1 Tax=Sphingobacterium multivorum TaxID=28454 RepID=A0A2X2IS78_SPHMU|nr:Uncharacterised protein [Sphingobacterium multivorum]